MAEISDYNETGEMEEIEEIAPEEEMSEEDVKSYIGHLLDDAISYSDDELGQDRITSGKYYSGHLPEQDDEGRSGVVSYDVRDTVNQIIPSMMRIFFGSKRIMSFAPNGPEDVQMALLKAGQESIKTQRNAMESKTREALIELQKKGLVFNTIDKNLFREKAQIVYAKNAERVGGMSLIDQIVSSKK